MEQNNVKGDTKSSHDDSAYYDYEEEIADRRREWLDDLAEDARFVNGLN